jgi:hypothetical protein
VPTAPLAPSASLPLKVDASAKPETISGLETYSLYDERTAGIGKRMGQLSAHNRALAVADDPLYTGHSRIMDWLGQTTWK